MADATGFRLNFAPHLGFPTPATPLFADLVGHAEPQAHIRFAAEQGFAMVQDPFTAMRSAAEQEQIGAVAASLGIGLSCFVYAPMDRALLPQWSRTDAEGRAELADQIDAAIAIGRRIGSRQIAILTGSDQTTSPSAQREAMSANLARMADKVGREGMVLCVEAVNARRLPTMLLHHLSDAIDVVRQANHPAVRLIFDTAHIQAMDGDIIGNLDRAWDLIELVQIADHPGRCEPGSGELNLQMIVDDVERRGFSGPVELEHGWSSPGKERQIRYLEWLGRWRTESSGAMSSQG